MFSLSLNSKARGVAILINKNTPLTIQETVSDPLGWYVLINWQIYSENCMLLNLYAPNHDDASFMQEIFLKASGGH